MCGRNRVSIKPAAAQAVVPVLRLTRHPTSADRVTGCAVKDRLITNAGLLKLRNKVLPNLGRQSTFGGRNDTSGYSRTN